MEKICRDAVHHPSHYTFGTYEVFDVLIDWFPADPLLWQVGKYISRAAHKGNALEDLQKAAWYLERRIEMEARVAYCNGCVHSNHGGKTNWCYKLGKSAVGISECKHKENKKNGEK